MKNFKTYGEFINESRMTADTEAALDNMNDWLPEDELERYLEILNQERPPAMVKFLKKHADMKVLKKYKIKEGDLGELANILMNESVLTVENNYIVNSMMNEGFDKLPDVSFKRLARPPKRFTVKQEFTVDGTNYSKGDYALKKKRPGGGIYLNMDKDEMLGIDTDNIARMQKADYGIYESNVATQVPAKTIAFDSKVNEMLDGEKLYKEIEKDRKTNMHSDIDDGSILFDHKDVAKGKVMINVNNSTGDITIEFRGKGPDGGGEWYGDQVSNMKDIYKQIKKYLKDEKDGKFNESVNEDMNEKQLLKHLEAVKKAMLKDDKAAAPGQTVPLIDYIEIQYGNSIQIGYSVPEHDIDGWSADWSYSGIDFSGSEFKRRLDKMRPTSIEDVKPKDAYRVFVDRLNDEAMHNGYPSV